MPDPLTHYARVRDGTCILVLQRCHWSHCATAGTPLGGMLIEKNIAEGGSIRRRSKTSHSPSPTNTSKKHIYMWNDSCWTSTECWQKLNLQKRARNSWHNWVEQKKKREREREKRNQDRTSILGRELWSRKGTHILGSHLTDGKISWDGGTSKLLRIRSGPTEARGYYWGRQEQEGWTTIGISLHRCTWTFRGHLWWRLWVARCPLLRLLETGCFLCSLQVAGDLLVGWGQQGFEGLVRHGASWVIYRQQGQTVAVTLEARGRHGLLPLGACECAPPVAPQSPQESTTTKKKSLQPSTTCYCSHSLVPCSCPAAATAKCSGQRPVA